MAEDQLGQRNNSSAPKTPWTKIFSTFKVALDIKKLLLAAAGLLVMLLGWWLISEVFFLLGGAAPPVWERPAQATDLELQERWEDFKLARKRWNLRFQLAGRHNSEKQYYDLEDFALNNSLKEFEALQEIDKDLGTLEEIVDVVKAEPDQGLNYIHHKQTQKKFAIAPAQPDDKAFAEILGQSFQVRDIQIADAKEQTVLIGKTKVKIEDAKRFQEFSDFRTKAKELEALRRDKDRSAEQVTALQLYENFLNAPPGPKPHGQLSTLPWFEDRGPNPYLMIAGQLKDPAATATTPQRAAPAIVPGWFLYDQVPVLLEPLFRFLRPVVYLFETNVGFWNRLYLLFIILWTLLIWAYFGGAICRMAAVQLARNEKIGLRESLGFAKSRCRSLFFAPFLPLLFLGLLTFFLIVFGLLIGHTYFFGDIFLVPIFWPIILIFGLIMAVVLVGLIGYPLMNPTIATEGTDSFDALSRSYSYVYQAPWHYLWYSFLALVYGAVLIFFVGLMGSLLVYLGKWGLSQAPALASADPAYDREPHYLFVWAPTSFGWRDLLVGDSQHAVRETAVSRGGIVTEQARMSNTYMQSMSIPNYIGAFFVTLWIYLFFLLIAGFGYSYFWTAATLIYLLMRRHVDDTDIDEVYLEDEENLDVFTQEPPPPTTPRPSPASPSGFQMVDTPELRTTPLPTTSAPAAPMPTAPGAPAPSEPAPGASMSSGLAPAEAVPDAPASSEPAPSEPAPSEPAPSESEPRAPGGPAPTPPASTASTSPAVDATITDEELPESASEFPRALPDEDRPPQADDETRPDSEEPKP